VQADIDLKDQVEHLATFLTADRQMVKLVAASRIGRLWIYDPETGSRLHQLGHAHVITAVVSISSSPSAATPLPPRLVSSSLDGSVQGWDGEDGKMLGPLQNGHPVTHLAVWKEDEEGEGELATVDVNRLLRIFEGAGLNFTQRSAQCGVESDAILAMLPFKSAEGSPRLLIAMDGDSGAQVRLP
jgi:WD40 repeat protein